MTDTTNSPPATVLRGILVYLVLLALPISTARGDVVIDAGIHRYVQAEMDLNEIPAVALAVVRNGVVSQAAFGARRIGALEPATVDTPFDLASVSKSQTALAIVQLEEKGLMDRGQLITSYLPELRLAADPAWRKVTVRDLLQHKSGLRRRDDFKVPCCGLESEFDLRAASAALTRTELTSPPGAVFSYANSNYVLLAALVERVSGVTFPDYMAQEVFRPLGMHRTTVDRDQARAWGLADPHEWQWGRVRPSPSLFFGWRGSSLVKSTASDMGRYLEALLRPDGLGGSPLLPPAEWWDEIEGNYDLGWSVRAKADWLNGEMVLEHSGDLWGASTAVVLAPALRSGVAVLANLGACRANEMARSILRSTAGLEPFEPRRTPRSEIPDTWAIGFAACAVFLMSAQALYLRRVRRQRRRFSVTPWGAARSFVLLGLAAGLLLNLFAAARPWITFPTTARVALPLLALAAAAMMIFGGLLALTPRVAAKEGGK